MMLKIKYMQKIIFLLFIGLLTGCTPDAPAKNWMGIAKILPIIVNHSEEVTLWRKDQISKGFSDANIFWKDIGIEFKMLEPEYYNNDKFFDQNGWLEYLPLMHQSEKIAKSRHVYPVYFVNSIKWGDKIYGGMSTYAAAPLGFQYGTIISSVSRYTNSSGLTIAHELGHAWNLRHTWSDKHSDTPSKDSTDCNNIIHCNILSYCFPSLTCSGFPFLTIEQIEEVRRWSLSSSRIHVLESPPPVPQTLFPLEETFVPILDPVQK